MELPINLFDYQDKVVRKALSNDSYALFVDMGLGKTFMALVIAFARKNYNNINRVMIISPKTLSGNWEKEIEEKIRPVFGTRWTIKVNNLASLSKQEAISNIRDYENLKYDIVFDIINFEKLSTIFEDIENIQYDMVIIDESTRIKNPDAIRSQAVFAFIGNIPYRLILTGSPIVKNVTDLWMQLKIVNGIHISFKDFKKKIKKKDWTTLTSNNIVVLKKEDIDNFKFPEKIYKVFKFELSNEQKKAYVKIKTALLKESLMFGKARILSSLIKFQRITSGFNPLKNLSPFQDNRKMKLLKKILLSGVFEPPYLIWSSFVLDIEKIHRELVSEGLRGALIYGAISQDKRIDIINRFQNYEYDFLVAHPVVMGIGTTLTASNVCIYYANTFRFEDRIQSEDRIHRVNQKKDVCYYIDLVARNTIDEIVLENLKNKRNISDMSIDEIKRTIKKV